MNAIVETIENDLTYPECSNISISEMEIEEIPESTIYIDRHTSYYLNAEQYKVEFDYAIDGNIFKETKVDEDYVQFEVYAAKVSNNMSSSDESDIYSMDSDDDDMELEYSIEIVPQGVIVNSIVYIPERHWHTIIDLADTLVQCAVCDVFISLDSCDKHIDSNSHNLYLNQYTPLKKYDLNIIRKIHNFYHCGQCNEIFPLKDINEHFCSQSHKKSILLSINKASTILNNNATIDNDTVDNDCLNNSDDSNDNNNDTFKGISYASIAKKPKAMEMPKYLIIDLDTKKIKVAFDSWHMIIVTKANTYHCMACNTSEHIRYKGQHCINVDHVENLMKCTVIEEFKDHLVRQVNNCDSLYHCSHCNNIQYKIEMERHIDIMHNSKNKANERKISLNSSSSSRENLSPYDSVTKQGNTQSSNKNAPSNDKNVPRNNKNASSNDKNASSNDKNASSNDKNASSNDKNASSNDKNASSNDKNAPSNNNKPGNMPETDKIVIYPFGYKVAIPILSYNIILKCQQYYYCGLCAKSLNINDLSLHIQDLTHIQLMQTTPFLSFYGINLIRSIRELLHCTICNVTVPPINIFVHNSDLYHRQLLSQTLKIPLTKLPTFTAPPHLATTNGHNFQMPFQAPKAPLLPYPPQMIPYRPQIIGIPNPVQNMQYNQSNNGKQPIMRPFSPQIEVNRPQSPFNRPRSPFSQPQIAQNATSGDKIGNNIGGAKIAKVSECQTVNDVTSESEDNLDESMDSVEVYNTEEYIYLKLRNIYFKITFSSYNTLVHVGDGSRYCFICASNVGCNLKKHVDSRSHLENIDKYHFVDKYEKHLLRQAYLSYHCSICNVILTQKEIKQHTQWSTHNLEMQIAQSTAKKSRRKDIDSGVKQFTIKTVKDQIFLNMNIAKTKILTNVKISNIKDTESQTLGKNKMINFKNKVLKISFANWHSIRKVDENVSKCIMCLMKIDGKDLMVHVGLESHINNLNNTFNAKYFPALIRPVNDVISNCIFCNVQLLNTHINSHIRGTRHKKTVEVIFKESASTNTYEDCEGDMLTV